MSPSKSNGDRLISKNVPFLEFFDQIFPSILPQLQLCCSCDDFQSLDGRLNVPSDIWSNPSFPILGCGLNFVQATTFAS